MKLLRRVCSVCRACELLEDETNEDGGGHGLDTPELQDVSALWKQERGMERTEMQVW